MDEYKIVEDGNYVMQELEQRTYHPVRAMKTGNVKARVGNIGEQIITWSVDENGNELVEKVNKVTLDDKTNRPAWVVTKVDKNGNPILDKNGHPNEWIVSDSEFSKKYEIDKDNEGLYRPRRTFQIFDRVDKNITLVNKGKIMKISRGGYINLTNPDNIYGVSARDFYDTYEIEQVRKTL